MTADAPLRHDRLLVLIGPGRADDPAVAADGPFDLVLTLDEVAALARTGAIRAHILRWRRVVALAEAIEAVPRPLLLEALLRLLSRGSAVLKDRRGRSRPLGPGLPRAAVRMSADWALAPGTRRAIETALAELEALNRGPQRPTLSPTSRKGPVAMVRTDLWLGVKAGGAVAHTAGIANAFAEAGMAPVLAAYEANPILDDRVRPVTLPLPRRFWNMPDLMPLAANLEALPALERLLDEVRPTLVYHRLAAHSFAVALAARRRGLPLIVEYNGSEVWIARHWGRPMRHEALSARIEAAVLAAATRISVVSAPLRDPLVARGVPEDRIVLQPNGVDTMRFRPDLDGGPVRDRLQLPRTAKVIGFIGTFGAWHGAPVLIEAWAQLLARHADLAATARLLLIGDGPERGLVEARIATLGLGSTVVLAGLVAQGEAAAHLAACDVLVAPHVANADGSAFFGSPTKVFEYMGIGRAIAASRLGQIGEVLEDGRNAFLVPPGDATALADAMAQLIGDPELAARLGAAARADAVAHHSWGRRLAHSLA